MIIPLIAGLTFTLNAFANSNPPTKSAEKAEKIEVQKGDTLELSVDNLVAKVVKKEKKWSKTCENSPAWLIHFPSGIQLALTCGQAYGGVVRLHLAEDNEPRAGVVVGNDWGDEGCFEITSSTLRVAPKGALSVEVKTKFGGKHVDEGEQGCKQATEIKHFDFDVAKKAFQKK